MLLAITTGQRSHTLCVIDIRNMGICSEHIKIHTGDLLKQTGPTFQLEELYTERKTTNISLCLVYNVHKCLEITKPFMEK